jgi:hypothetical protein
MSKKLEEVEVKKIIILCFSIVIFPALALAHPGPQDKKGCHVCKKNCDAWSVPWNVKHCHGGRKEVPSRLSRPQAYGVKPIQSKTKLPGWEYGLNIKKIGVDRSVNSEQKK